MHAIQFNFVNAAVEVEAVNGEVDEERSVAPEVRVNSRNTNKINKNASFLRGKTKKLLIFMLSAFIILIS